MADKRSVRVVLVPDRPYYELPTGAVEFRAWLDEQIASVPAEFRDEIMIDFGVEYESPTVGLAYFRPETDGEASSRLAKEAADAADRKLMQEGEYRRLKAIFEPNNGGSSDGY